jgi:nicotinamide mononucleotide transporter
VLRHFTNAFAPFADSLLLTFSILGQFLLVDRRVENWWCWLFVNTISVPLYHLRKLDLTAALYVVYWFNALISLRDWRRVLATAESRVAGRPIAEHQPGHPEQIP